MGAYYVCKIIGTGKILETDGKDDPFRPISEYPVNWVMVGETGRGCLVYVSNPIPELDKDPQVIPLPKESKATFTRQEWNRFVTKLGGMNIGLYPNDYKSTRTTNQTVVTIGKMFEPDFNLEHFNVR